MKNMNKLLAATIAMVGFATTTYAQATATATATATVITPISIVKNVDMNFGNLAVQAGTGGTVILVPAGTRTATGGVTLPAAGGTISAATFTVTGTGTSTYTITLPTTVTLTRNTGTETMTAGTFTSTPTPTGTLVAGTQDISVGATLTVAAAQVPGVYVSPVASGAGSLDVTVNYN